MGAGASLETAEGEEAKEETTGRRQKNEEEVTITKRIGTTTAAAAKAAEGESKHAAQSNELSISSNATTTTTKRTATTTPPVAVTASSSSTGGGGGRNSPYTRKDIEGNILSVLQVVGEGNGGGDSDGHGGRGNDHGEGTVTCSFAPITKHWSEPSEHEILLLKLRTNTLTVRYLEYYEGKYGILEGTRDHDDVAPADAKEGEEEGVADTGSEWPFGILERRANSPFLSKPNSVTTTAPASFSASDAEADAATLFVRRFLKNVLANDHLFAVMDKSTLRRVAERMQRIETKPGEIVFRQGDRPDGGFYAVESGFFRVIVNGKEAQTHFLGPGQTFGSLAMLRCVPGGVRGRKGRQVGGRRSATVQSIDGGVLWTMDRELFRRACVHVAKRRDRIVDQFLLRLDLWSRFAAKWMLDDGDETRPRSDSLDREVREVKPITKRTLKRLSRRLVYHRVSKGCELKCASQSSTIYVLLEGRVDIVERCVKDGRDHCDDGGGDGNSSSSFQNNTATTATTTTTTTHRSYIHGQWFEACRADEIAHRSTRRLIAAEHSQVLAMTHVDLMSLPSDCMFRQAIVGELESESDIPRFGRSSRSSSKEKEQGRSSSKNGAVRTTSPTTTTTTTTSLTAANGVRAAAAVTGTIAYASPVLPWSRKRMTPFDAEIAETTARGEDRRGEDGSSISSASAISPAANSPPPSAYCIVGDPMPSPEREILAKLERSVHHARVLRRRRRPVCALSLEEEEEGEEEEEEMEIKLETKSLRDGKETKTSDDTVPSPSRCSDRTRRLLVDALSRSYLFNDLCANELDATIHAMKLRTFVQGEWIYCPPAKDVVGKQATIVSEVEETEWDDEKDTKTTTRVESARSDPRVVTAAADTHLRRPRTRQLDFFVVETGTLEVFRPTKEKKREREEFLSSGDTFGEATLLYRDASAHRPSIRSVSSGVTRVWTLGRRDFRRFRKLSAENRREKMRSFVRKNKVLSALPSRTMEDLVDSFVSHSFKKGATIIRENDDGDVCYFIESGRVEVTKEGERLRDLDEGSFFGELALLNAEPRSATVSCLTDVSCLVISRTAFDRLCSQMSDVIQRVMTSPKIVRKKSFFTPDVYFPELSGAGGGGGGCSSTADSGGWYDHRETKKSDENEAEVSRKKKNEEWGGDRDDGGEEAKQSDVVSTHAKKKGRRRKKIGKKTTSSASFSSSSEEGNESDATDASSSSDNESNDGTRHDYSINVCSQKDLVLRECIGEGSYGQVMLAQHRRTRTPLAVKRVPIKRKKRRKRRGKGAKAVTTTSSSSAAANTPDEAKILRRMSHALVSRMIGSFEVNDTLFLIMPFYRGGDLFSLITRRKSKRLTDHEARFYVGEIHLALHYLHKEGIVYRDLKLENVVLDERGHVKLIDFGLAKILKERGDRAFTICGTPEYMSPEMIRGRGYTTITDYWALGVLLHEMLVGFPPFGTREGSFETGYHIVNKIVCQYISDRARIEHLSPNAAHRNGRKVPRDKGSASSSNDDNFKAISIETGECGGGTRGGRRRYKKILALLPEVGKIRSRYAADAIVQLLDPRPPLRLRGRALEVHPFFSAGINKTSSNDPSKNKNHTRGGFQTPNAASAARGRIRGRDAGGRRRTSRCAEQWWADMRDLRLRPPWVPRTSSKSDTRHFDHFDFGHAEGEFFDG
eukprot:g4146.t1